MGKKVNLFRDASRTLRMAWYHLLNGPNFSYHGVPVKLPAKTPYPFKRDIIRQVYEEPERRLIEKYLNPKIPVVELGGSLGIVSAYVSSKLSDETPFIIVEANSSILDVCEMNANWRARSNPARLLHAAIAYECETVSFASSENVHLSAIASERVPGSESVPAATVSDVLSQISGKQSFTLIMDIEGMEYDVLEREPKVFANCDLAIIEFHPDKFAARGKSVDDFFYLAKSCGLKVLETDGQSAAFTATRFED